jgi:hypothetical protein
MMLLRISDWQKIRDQFNDFDKATINDCITGETICPRGCTLDEEKLGEPLARKIREATDAAQKETQHDH